MKNPITEIDYKVLRTARPAKYKRIPVFELEGRRWFDKKNGNTYHSATVYARRGKGAAFHYDLIGRIDYVYGYGDQWIQTCYEILALAGYFPILPPLESGMDGTAYHIGKYFREHPERIFASCQDVARKGDL